MTTTMSVRRIWGFEPGDGEMAAARRAGWRRSDLVWERLLEAALADHARGSAGRAAGQLRLADWLARLRFPKGDPRRATAAAGLARLLGDRGGKHQAARARAEFSGVDAFVAAMTVAPRARSSLFHLRMEARHRDTYLDNLRRRLGAIAAETSAHLATLPAGPRPPYRLASRWRGEKPAVFDDTRKLLAACLLIPD